jgi:hypothetical protein
MLMLTPQIKFSNCRFADTTIFSSDKKTINKYNRLNFSITAGIGEGKPYSLSLNER